MNEQPPQPKTIPFEIRYIPLMERLTEQDRRALADWVRSKKPDYSMFAKGFTRSQVEALLNTYEQALLSDLEEHEPTKN